MTKKKSIKKSVEVDLPVTKSKWEIVKIALISFFVCFGIYFISWNSKQINLEGSWKPTKIIIDGKDYLPNTILNQFDYATQILITNLGKSLDISTPDQKIQTNFSIKKDSNNRNYMILSSSEKSLNGCFEMKIDTIDLGPQEYRVEVKLHLDKTYINFQKEVVVPPWKPEPPKRGQV